MNNINYLFQSVVSYANRAEEEISEHPWVAVGTTAVVSLSLLGLYLANRREAFKKKEMDSSRIHRPLDDRIIPPPQERPLVPVQIPSARHFETLSARVVPPQERPLVLDESSVPSRSDSVELVRREPVLLSEGELLSPAAALDSSVIPPIQTKKSRRDPDIDRHPDIKTIRKLAKEIIDLKPTIGDAASYKFVASHGRYVDDEKTKRGSLAMIAAGMRAYARGEQYGNSPFQIVKMGEDLLRMRSGQCDHMAAAVIAKIVEHIQNGGNWGLNVELMGNGGHAFVVLNRDDSKPSHEPSSWDDAVIVDTWLGRLGVHENYKDRLPAGENGVILTPKEYAKFFGAQKNRIKTTCKFTAGNLRAMAFAKTRP